MERVQIFIVCERLKFGGFFFWHYQVEKQYSFTSFVYTLTSPIHLFLKVKCEFWRLGNRSGPRTNPYVKFSPVFFVCDVVRLGVHGALCKLLY